jgi:arginyl-tRNA synthetase
MRSPNIGEAVKRLLKVLGHDVIGDVHLGDLGRQSGMLISEYKRMFPDSPFFDENYKGEYPQIELTTKDLGEMYPRANIAASNDESRMEEVRHITAEIDKGNPAYTALWKQMVAISSKDIKKVYDKLNCTFELWEGELDAFKWIPNVLDIMKPYLYESEGALVCDVKRDDDNKPMPPLMVIKNDGATIYGTRDLGTIYSRMERFKPDEIWYFTDERQGLYFEQVFRASYKTGIVPETTLLKHFGFGTINGRDGKPYKTRDGGVMELSSLIDIIYNEVLKNIKEEITGSERNKIADTLSIATLKFADLLPFRKTDYVFDPEKFSSLEGKTGPYILYTLVRIKSLLKKSDIENINLIDIENDDVKDILIKILETSRVLTKSYNEATLNYIEELIYEILSLYNKFYNNNQILNEKNMDKKITYLALSKLVYTTIHNLLNILAIDEVERM